MSNFLKQRLGQFRRESGFTILEVLIAVGILGLIGVAVLQGFDTSHRATGTLDEQVTARTLITNHIEAIKMLPYSATYPNAGENIAIPDQYIVVVETECSNDDIIWQDCTGSETLQRIIVSVFREGGKPVMRICTFRTPRYE